MSEYSGAAWIIIRIPGRTRPWIRTVRAPCTAPGWNRAPLIGGGFQNSRAISPMGARRNRPIAEENSGLFSLLVISDIATLNITPTNSPRSAPRPSAMGKKSALTEDLKEEIQNAALVVGLSGSFGRVCGSICRISARRTWTRDKCGPAGGTRRSACICTVRSMFSVARFGV